MNHKHCFTNYRSLSNQNHNLCVQFSIIHSPCKQTLAQTELLQEDKSINELQLYRPSVEKKGHRQMIAVFHQAIVKSGPHTALVLRSRKHFYQPEVQLSLHAGSENFRSFFLESQVQSSPHAG